MFEAEESIIDHLYIEDRFNKIIGNTIIQSQNHYTRLHIGHNYTQFSTTD